MIKFTLKEMLEKKGLTAYALHTKSDKKLHQSVIGKIKNNESKALNLDTLDMICKFLECEPQDLISYVSENVARATQNTKHTQNENTTQSASDNKNILTFADAFSELERIGKRKSESSLRRYLKGKKLKGKLVGGEWQIEKSDFENFINADFFKSLK